MTYDKRWPRPHKIMVLLCDRTEATIDQVNRALRDFDRALKERVNDEEVIDVEVLSFDDEEVYREINFVPDSYFAVPTLQPEWSNKRSAFSEGIVTALRDARDHKKHLEWFGIRYCRPVIFLLGGNRAAGMPEYEEKARRMLQHTSLMTLFAVGSEADQRLRAYLPPPPHGAVLTCEFEDFFKVIQEDSINSIIGWIEDDYSLRGFESWPADLHDPRKLEGMPPAWGGWHPGKNDPFDLGGVPYLAY